MAAKKQQQQAVDPRQMSLIHQQQSNSLSTNLVDYGDIDDKEIQVEREEFEASRSQSQFVTIREGTTRLRFVPPPPGGKWRQATWVHYLTVPGLQDRVRFVCPRKATDGKRRCDACARWLTLQQSKNPSDNKQAKAWKPQPRFYAIVIQRGCEGDGPKVWGFGTMIQSQLYEILEDSNPDEYGAGGRHMTNPTKGYDVKVIRKGSGPQDTKYTLRTCAPNPLGTTVEQMNEWILGQQDLARYVEALSDEDIAKVLRGEQPGMEDEDARDINPPAPRQTRQAGPYKVPIKEKTPTVEDEIVQEYEDDSPIDVEYEVSDGPLD